VFPHGLRETEGGERHGGVAAGNAFSLQFLKRNESSTACCFYYTAFGVGIGIGIGIDQLSRISPVPCYRLDADADAEVDPEGNGPVHFMIRSFTNAAIVGVYFSYQRCPAC